MKTPPIAGVRMKYWYMNALSMSLPPVTATSTVLASVIRTGSHSAFVWTAIQGSDSMSWRTCTGRKAALNAVAMLIRGGVPVGRAAVVDAEVVPGRLDVGDSASMVPSTGSVAVSAR